MKATFTFDQVAHLVRLAQQKGVESGDQLQDHVDAGPLSDVFEIPNPKKITLEARDAARHAYGLPPLNPPLLKTLGTIVVPALPRFGAREKFVVNVGEDAPVKISYIGENFTAWFRDAVEEQVAETILRYAELTRSKPDGPILKELGSFAEITLSQIWWLMEQQPNGKAGTLANDGRRANIFYPPGLLRAVFVSWDGGSWLVSARSVSDPGRWRDGRRVFSRNSSVAVTA